MVGRCTQTMQRIRAESVSRRSALPCASRHVALPQWQRPDQRSLQCPVVTLIRSQTLRPPPHSPRSTSAISSACTRDCDCATAAEADQTEKTKKGPRFGPKQFGYAVIDRTIIPAARIVLKTMNELMAAASAAPAWRVSHGALRPLHTPLSLCGRGSAHCDRAGRPVHSSSHCGAI